MKNNKTLIITNIILLSCIVIGLLIFMIFGLNGKLAFWEDKSELINKISYTSINNVEIDVKSYDIEILENTIDDIEIEVYGNKKTKNNLEIMNNDNLRIKQNKSTFCFGFCYNSKIIIKLPKSYQGRFNINTISGDITSNISFKDSNNIISSTSGDIKLSNIENGKITSTSGDIDINYLNNGKIKTTSGDIEVNNFGNGDITSTSGEIEIGTLTGFGDIETTSGDIMINKFEILDNTTISSTSGDIKIKLINNAYITADSVSGDKNIRGSKGDYELKIKTISGDITVR